MPYTAESDCFYSAMMVPQTSDIDSFTYLNNGDYLTCVASRTGNNYSVFGTLRKGNTLMKSSNQNLKSMTVTIIKFNP